MNDMTNTEDVVITNAESLNKNEAAPNNEHTKEDLVSLMWRAKKEKNKTLFHVLRRYFGLGKHFQQRQNKGSFGRAKKPKSPIKMN